MPLAHQPQWRQVGAGDDLVRRRRGVSPRLAGVPRRCLLGDAVPEGRQRRERAQFLQLEVRRAARRLAAREGRPHRLAQGGGDLGLRQQAHLGLRRMDVHIDRAGGQFEEERRQRVPPAREEGSICRLQRLRQAARRRPAPVDEKGDVASARAVELRPADHARNTRPGDRDLLDRQQRPRDLAAVDTAQDILQPPAARRAEGGVAVEGQAEAPLRVGQRVAAHQRADLRRLGARVAHELQPRRLVGEEVAHGDGRAARPRPGEALDGPAVLDQHARARAAPLGRRDEQHLRHRADAGERLAAEPEAVDAPEVVGLAQLAGGVSREGQLELVRRDARAVVADLDRSQPAAAQFDRDLPRPRVDRVLQQLLHHRHRALDHLARRDPLDHARVELADRAAGHPERRRIVHATQQSHPPVAAPRTGHAGAATKTS